MDSIASLQNTVAKVERARRHLEKKFWRLQRPGWCKANEPFAHVFEDQELLALEGSVVWGQIVQANAELFGAPENDWPGAPAVVVYSTIVEHDTQERLAELSSQLFDLKHASKFEDDEQQRFGAMLADEETLFIDAPIPRSLKSRLPARCTYVYVARKHIANRQLALTQIPLLIHEDSECAIVVPSKYWDDEFLTLWAEESTEHRATDLVDISRYGIFRKARLGMGSFFSIGGVSGLLFMVALLFLVNEDYQYSLVSEPTRIESSKIVGMKDNSYVEFEAELSYADAFHYNDGKDLLGVLITPAIGDERYVVSFPAGKNPGVDRRTETVVGRLRKRSWTGSHDVGPFLLDVVDRCRQLGRRTPGDLIVVVNGEHPGSSWPGIVIFLAVALIFWLVARRIRRTFQFFRDDDAFAKFLLKRREAQS